MRCVLGGDKTNVLAVSFAVNGQIAKKLILSAEEKLRAMKRVTVIAKGEVQRVGYRDEVQRIARRLNITGYVENVVPYDVRIVAEGDEERLNEFVERIKIRRYPIFVEEVEVEWSEATGEFDYFEIKRGTWQEELFERLDAAGRLLYRSVELGERAVELGEKNVKLSERIVKLTERAVELGEKSVKLGERAVELGERSVELGERSIETIKEESEKTRVGLGRIIREESEKTRVELGKTIREESEKTRVELGRVIREESKKTRVELGGTIREESEKTRVELGNTIREESEKTRTELKSEIRGVKEEIADLRVDLREYMESNLSKIREEIAEIKEALRRAGIM